MKESKIIIKESKTQKQSLYRSPGWGCWNSLQVTKMDRWIKIKKRKTQEGITIPMPMSKSLKASLSH